MYEDWFLLVEISSVLLGGGRSIQLGYGGVCMLYFTAASRVCQRKREKKVGETPCNHADKGI